MNYMFETEKTVNFSASRRFSSLGDDKALSKCHGHDFEVIVVLGSNALDHTGVIFEYGVIEALISRRYNNTNLNDVILDTDPTNEAIAVDIYDKFYHTVLKNLNDGTPDEDKVKVIKISVRGGKDFVAHFYPKGPQ